MMSVPLLLGTDLTKLSNSTLAAITNKEMISINQDPLVKIPARINLTTGGAVSTSVTNQQIYVKDLANGDKAVAILNQNTSTTSITLDLANHAGLTGTVKARDLWTHQDFEITAPTYTVSLPARGIAVLRLSSGASSKTITRFELGGVPGIIDNVAGTISVTLPMGTDATNLIPVIIHTGKSISPASGVAQNFSGIVYYTVTAEDGSTKTYAVVVVQPALVMQPQATVCGNIIKVSTELARIEASDLAENVAVIAALYGLDGKLLAMDVTQVAIEDFCKYVPAANMLLIPAGVSDYTLKVFIWDSVTFIPLYRYFDVTPAVIGNVAAIDGAGARAKVANGAVLLDVRFAEEFAQDHIEGAIHIDYRDILIKAESIIPDKNTEIVVYCSAGKRAAQASSALAELGYTNIYILSSMSAWYN
jgi:rhodanese-related sulfurtransferase